MPVEYRDDAGATDGDILANAVDISSIGDGGNGGSGGTGSAPEPERKPGKRRGRPPGTGGGKSAGAGKEKTRNTLDLSSLTGLFVGVHVIAAQMTDVPELVIDQREGEDFMKAAQNVMRHYSVETTQKTIDWISFGGVCCMIYGTRFGAYMLRKRQEKLEKSSATAIQYPTWRGSSGKVQGSEPEKNRPGAQPAPQTASHAMSAQDHVAVEMEFDAE